MMKYPDLGRKILATLVAGSMFLWLSGCSTTRPILYPNAKLQSAGQEVAQQDIEACKQMAESAGAQMGNSTGRGGQMVARTAAGAGAGAATGAVAGAISGGSVVKGSMIGAATGATWGLVREIFYSPGSSSQPNQTYLNFVNRCLQEKGYEVTGWQ